MKSFTKRLQLLIGIVALAFAYGDLAAQCKQRIEVSNIVADNEKSQVDFDIRVIADESYTGQLFRIEGTLQTEVTSFSGSSERSFTFSDLQSNNEIFYRVIIEYTGEEKFLCRRRVKDILITDTK